MYFVCYSCDVNAGRNGIFGACIIICMDELSNTDRRYLNALAGSISLRRRRRCKTDVPERCRGGDARPRVSEETPGSPVACPERGEDEIYRTTVVRPSPRPRKSNAFPNGNGSTYGIRSFSKEYTIPRDIISSLPPPPTPLHPVRYHTRPFRALLRTHINARADPTETIVINTCRMYSGHRRCFARGMRTRCEPQSITDKQSPNQLDCTYSIHNYCEFTTVLEGPLE